MRSARLLLQALIALPLVGLLVGCASQAGSAPGSPPLVRQKAQANMESLREKCAAFRPAPMAEGLDKESRITPPRKLSGDPPSRPGADRFGNVRRAEVCINAVITVDGTVIDPEVVHSNNEKYTANALKAIKTWRFDPATLNGEKVETRYQVRLSYNPQ